MEFHIKRCGKAFIVEDGAGVRRSEHRTFEAASTALAAIEAAERHRAANDPAVKQRRNEKTAYRKASGNPWLLALFLPDKKTKLRRDHERWQARAHTALEFWERKPPDVSPSDWADRQQIEAAAATRRKQGDVMREKVAMQWSALSNVPARQRSGRIAEILKIDVRQVRRLRPLK